MDAESGPSELDDTEGRYGHEEPLDKRAERYAWLWNNNKMVVLEVTHRRVSFGGRSGDEDPSDSKDNNSLDKVV
ncbi:MAG: hypothetical protein M1831_002764 [Alyxoria varia]|nr:MAG: hypothetical protein M1831_002764 [Alyxoria varia]